MSLTSILRSKERQNLKNWFIYNFPNPGLQNKSDILVSPFNTHPPYGGDIGTAFDYLMRFNLERINKPIIIKKDWVAKDGLNLILWDIRISKEEKIKIGYHRDRLVDKIEFKQYLETEFERAKQNYQKFIKNGKLTNDLIKSSIFLARLDIRLRPGVIDANLDKFEPEKIEELEKLFNCVPWDKFKAKKHCILNPTFGKGSGKVYGADADLIIDDVLIDIKSSKYLKIEREDLNQVIGYYLLSLIGSINGKERSKIKKIGIYFARYGHLWEYPLSNYFDNKEFEKRKDEFVKLVNDRNLQLVNSEIFKTRNKSTYTFTTYEIVENDFKCPYCESKYFIRQGQSSAGKFRYKCRDCNRSYSSNIETDEIREIIKRQPYF